LFHLVILIVKDFDRYLVRIIVQVDEPVVEEEATIALLPIAIVDLLSPLDVVEGLDHEAAAVVRVVPGRLPWALVVEHVRVGNEAVGLHALYLDAEDATGDHHADLGVLTEGELSEFGNFFTDEVVV
jgi:hypothetical protein